MRNPFRFRRRRRDEPQPQPSEGEKVRLTPDGLRITEFPAPVTHLLRLYGVGGNYAQIYAAQPNVRTAVRIYAKEAAELNLKLFFKDDRGPTKPSARIEVGHPMMDLLAEPLPGESVYRFWYALFADIEIYDIAYWLKVRSGGRVRALKRIPPANLLPVRDPITYSVTHFRDARGNTYLPQELVVFWGYDPATDHGNVSPMESIRRIIAEDMAAGLDREGRWRNSARKDGVIERVVDSKDMSDNAKEAFLLDVEDAYGGATGSGRPLMLEPGMVYKDVQWSPREMEYINARKLSRLEVAAHFDIPPAMMAAAANNRDPDENTLKFFYRSSLPPRLTRVEHEIEAQLLPEFERQPVMRRQFYTEFNLDAKLRGSFEEQAAIMATTIGGPVITLNEGRSRLNLPPIPGGDEVLIPLNSLRGGGPQASPQNPVQTPADGLEPVGTTPGGGTSGQASRVLGHKEAAALLEPEAESVEEVLAKVEERAAGYEAEALLRETRARYEERHAQVMRKFFARQGNTAKTAALKKDRWDRELAEDLFGVQYQTVQAVGSDPIASVEYLKSYTAQAADRINAATIGALLDGGDPGELFGADRAAELGVTLTASAMEWAQDQAKVRV